MGSPITPELVYHLKTVSDPCLSPDGSKLAFTYTWVDPERLESCSRLMLLPLGPTETAEAAGGAERPRRWTLPRAAGMDYPSLRRTGRLSPSCGLMIAVSGRYG